MPPCLARRAVLVAVVVAVALAACQTGGGPADGGTCKAPNVLRYERPGCGLSAPAPVCGDPTMDLCLSLVCSCAGRVIGGCDYFAEPWSRRLTVPGATTGDPCDPAVADMAAVDLALPDPVACGDKTCAPNELCIFICDCCGFPSDMASSRYQCIPDKGQCNFPDPFGRGFSGAPAAMFPCQCVTQRTGSCPCV